MAIKTFSALPSWNDIEQSPTYQELDQPQRKEYFDRWQSTFTEVATEDPDNITPEVWEGFKKFRKQKSRDLTGATGLTAANAEAEDEAEDETPSRIQLAARKRELEAKSGTFLGGTDLTRLQEEERNELANLRSVVADTDEDDLDAIEKVANDDEDFHVADGAFFASPKLTLDSQRYRDTVRNNKALTPEQKVEALMRGRSLREETGARLKADIDAADMAFEDTWLGGMDKFRAFERDVREGDPDATDADIMEKWQKENGSWYSNLGTQIKIGGFQGAAQIIGAYYGVKGLVGIDTENSQRMAQAATDVNAQLAGASKATGGATLAADATAMVVTSLATLPAGPAGRGVMAAGRIAAGTAGRFAAAATAGRLGGSALVRAATLKAGGEAAAKITARQLALAKTGGIAASAFAAGVQSAGGAFNQYFDQFLKEELAEIPEANRTPQIIEEARRRARDGARGRALVSGAVTTLITAGFGATGAEKLAAPQASRAAQAAKEGLVVFLGKSLSKEALSEAGEEGLDALANGIIDKATVNPGKPLEEIVEETLKSALAGGILGAGMSAPFAVSDAFKARAEAKKNPAVAGLEQTAARLDGLAPASAAAVREMAGTMTQEQLDAKAAADAAAADALLNPPVDAGLQKVVDQAAKTGGAPATKAPVNVVPAEAAPVAKGNGFQELSDEDLENNIRQTALLANESAVEATQANPTAGSREVAELAQKKLDMLRGERERRKQTAAPAPAATSVGVPMMVTKGMEKQLLDRGYTKQQVDAMKPQEAQDILNPPAAPAPVDVVVESSPALAPAVGEAPAPAAAVEGAPTPEFAPTAEEQVFQTSKGSEYILHSDGTTTRNKAARPEHPGEEGVQPRSSRTIFVSEEGMNALGIVQTEGVKFNIEQMPDGRWAARAVDGPNKGKFYQTSITEASDTPSAGLMPVEIWNREGRPQAVHFGNKITGVSQTAAPAPATPARPAATTINVPAKPVSVTRPAMTPEVRVTAVPAPVEEAAPAPTIDQVWDELITAKSKLDATNDPAELVALNESINKLKETIKNSVEPAPTPAEETAPVEEPASEEEDTVSIVSDEVAKAVTINEQEARDYVAKNYPGVEVVTTSEATADGYQWRGRTNFTRQPPKITVNLSNIRDMSQLKNVVHEELSHVAYNDPDISKSLKSLVESTKVREELASIYEEGEVFEEAVVKRMADLVDSYSEKGAFNKLLTSIKSYVKGKLGITLNDSDLAYVAYRAIVRASKAINSQSVSKAPPPPREGAEVNFFDTIDLELFAADEANIPEAAVNRYIDTRLILLADNRLNYSRIDAFDLFKFFQDARYGDKPSRDKVRRHIKETAATNLYARNKIRESEKQSKSNRRNFMFLSGTSLLSLGYFGFSSTQTQPQTQLKPKAPAQPKQAKPKPKSDSEKIEENNRRLFREFKESLVFDKETSDLINNTSEKVGKEKNSRLSVKVSVGPKAYDPVEDLTGLPEVVETNALDENRNSISFTKREYSEKANEIIKKREKLEANKDAVVSGVSKIIRIAEELTGFKLSKDVNIVLRNFESDTLTSLMRSRKEKDPKQMVWSASTNIESGDIKMNTEAIYDIVFGDVESKINAASTLFNEITHVMQLNKGKSGELGELGFTPTLPYPIEVSYKAWLDEFYGPQTDNIEYESFVLDYMGTKVLEQINNVKRTEFSDEYITSKVKENRLKITHGRDLILIKNPVRYSKVAPKSAKATPEQAALKDKLMVLVGLAENTKNPTHIRSGSVDALNLYQQQASALGTSVEKLIGRDIPVVPKFTPPTQTNESQTKKSPTSSVPPVEGQPAVGEEAGPTKKRAPVRTRQSKSSETEAVAPREQAIDLLREEMFKNNFLPTVKEVSEKIFQRTGVGISYQDPTGELKQITDGLLRDWNARYPAETEKPDGTFTGAKSGTAMKTTEGRSKEYIRDNGGAVRYKLVNGKRVGFFSNLPLETAMQLNAGLKVNVPVALRGKLAPGITINESGDVVSVFEPTRNVTVTGLGEWYDAYKVSPQRQAAADTQLRAGDKVKRPIEELRKIVRAKTLKLSLEAYGRGKLTPDEKVKTQKELVAAAEDIAALLNTQNPRIPRVGTEAFVALEAPIEMPNEADVYKAYEAEIRRIEAAIKTQTKNFRDLIIDEINDGYVYQAVLNQLKVDIRTAIAKNPQATPKAIAAGLKAMDFRVRNVALQFKKRASSRKSIIAGSIDSDELTDEINKVSTRVNFPDDEALANTPITPEEVETLRAALQRMNDGEENNASLGILQRNPFLARQALAAIKKNDDIKFKVGNNDLIFEHGPPLSSDESTGLAAILKGFAPEKDTTFVKSIEAQPNMARFLLDYISLGRDVLRKVVDRAGRRVYSDTQLQEMGLLAVAGKVSAEDSTMVPLIIAQASSNLESYGSAGPKKARGLLQTLLLRAPSPIKVASATAPTAETPVPAPVEEAVKEEKAKLVKKAAIAPTVAINKGLSMKPLVPAVNNTPEQKMGFVSELSAIGLSSTSDVSAIPAALNRLSVKENSGSPHFKALARVFADKPALLNGIDGVQILDDANLAEDVSVINGVLTLNVAAMTPTADGTPRAPEALLRGLITHATATLTSPDAILNDTQRQALEKLEALRQEAIEEEAKTRPEGLNPRFTDALKDTASFMQSMLTSPAFSEMLRSYKTKQAKSGSLKSPWGRFWSAIGELLTGKSVAAGSGLHAGLMAAGDLMTDSPAPNKEFLDSLKAVLYNPQAAFPAAPSIGAEEAALIDNADDAIELADSQPTLDSLDERLNGTDSDPEGLGELDVSLQPDNAMLGSQDPRMQARATGAGRLEGPPTLGGVTFVPLVKPQAPAGTEFLTQQQAFAGLGDAIEIVDNLVRVVRGQITPGQAETALSPAALQYARDKINVGIARLKNSPANNKDQLIEVLEDMLAFLDLELDQVVTIPAKLDATAQTVQEIDTESLPAESELPLPEPTPEGAVPYTAPAVETTTETGTKKALDLSPFLRAAAAKTGREIKMVDAGPGIPDQPIYVKHDRSDTAIYVNKSALETLVAQFRARGYNTAEMTTHLNALLDREASTLAILQRFSSAELAATAVSLSYETRRKIVERVYGLKPNDPGYNNYFSRGAGIFSQGVFADLVQLGADYYRMMRQVSETGHTTEDIMDMVGSSPGTFARTVAFLRATSRQFMAWWRAYGDLNATRAILNIDSFLEAVSPSITMVSAPTPDTVPLPHEEAKIVANNTGRSIEEVMADAKLVERARKSMEDDVFNGDTLETTQMTADEARQFVTELGLVDGDPASVADALARIANMENVSPATRAIALELSKHPSIADLNGFSFENLSVDGKEEAAYYDGTTHFLGLDMSFMLDENASSAKVRWSEKFIVEALVHEAAHAATANVVRQYTIGAPLPASVTQAIEGLEQLRKALAKQEGASKFAYQLSNLDEFIAGVMANEQFVSWVATLPNSVGNNLPGETGNRSLINRILHQIYKTIFPDMEMNSVLEKSLSRIFDISAHPRISLAQAEGRMSAMYPANSLVAATSEQDTGAYHYGDAGIGRDTQLSNMSYQRSTGHFGTGTYFLGKKDGEARAGRPLKYIDLTGLNLAKTSVPYMLHDGLKLVNKMVLRNEAPDYSEPRFDGRRALSSLWSLGSKHSDEDIQEAIAKTFALFNDGANDGLRTPATYFMQFLGYDGIDVRGTEADNTDYGSVVYPPLRQQLSGLSEGKLSAMYPSMGAPSEEGAPKRVLGSVTGERKRTEALKNSLPAMPANVAEYLKESTYFSGNTKVDGEAIDKFIGPALAAAVGPADFSKIFLDVNSGATAMTGPQRQLALLVIGEALNRRVNDLTEALAKAPFASGFSYLRDFEGVAGTVWRTFQDVASDSGQMLNVAAIARERLNPKYISETYRTAATKVNRKKLPKDVDETFSDIQDEAVKTAEAVVKKSPLTKKIIESLTKTAGANPADVQKMSDLLEAMKAKVSNEDSIPTQMAEWVSEQMLGMLDAKMKAEIKKVADAAGVPAETFFEEYSDEVKRLVAERINKAILDATPKAAELTEDQKKEAKRIALQNAIQEMVASFEFAPSVERALNESRAKILTRLEAEKGSSPEALQRYADAKAAVANMTFDLVPLDKATQIIRSAFDMRQQIYLNITDRNASVAMLTATITNATDLTAEQAAKVAEAFKSAYEAELNRRIDKVMKNYAKRMAGSVMKGSGGAERYSRSERFLRLANLGGLRKEEFYNAMAMEFDLPSYDPVVAEELDREATRILGMPMGSVQRADATRDLNARVVSETYKSLMATYGAKAIVKDRSMTWEYLAGIPVAMWKSGVLSGFGTAQVNFGYGTFQSLLDLGFNSVAYATKAKDPKLAAGNLMILMKAVGWMFDPAQKSDVWNEVKRAALTGRTRFGSEQSENMLVLERDVPAIDAPVIKQLMTGTKDFFKLLGRIGSVIDATVSVPASIARQRLALSYALTMNGADRKKISEIMQQSFTPDEITTREINEILEAEREQFRNTSRPDLAMESRRAQLMDERRTRLYEDLTSRIEANSKEDFMEASRESARFANLGTTPTGLAGWIFDGIFGTIDRKTKGLSSVIVSFPRAMGNLLDFSLAMSVPGLALARAYNVSPSNLMGEDSKYRREEVIPGSIKFHKMIAQAVVATIAQTAIGVAYAYGMEDENEGRVPWFMVYGKGYIDSEKNRQLRYRQPEWAPYTLKMGDLYLSWKDLPGINLILGGLASITDWRMETSQKDPGKLDKVESLTNAAVAFIKAVTVKNSMQGLAQAGELISDNSLSEAVTTRNLTKMASNFISGATNPRLVRDVVDIGRGLAGGGEYTLKDTRGFTAAAISLLPANTVYGGMFGQRDMLNSMGRPVTNFWYAPMTKRILPASASDNLDPVITPLATAGLFISPVKASQMSFDTYKDDSDEVDLEGGPLSRFGPEVEMEAIRMFGENMAPMMSQELIKDLTDQASQGRRGKEEAQERLNDICKRARDDVKAVIQERIFAREILPDWQKK